MRNVCNGAFVANEILIAGIVEMLVKDPVQALEFILIARCRILIVFFRITNELGTISAEGFLLHELTTYMVRLPLLAGR